MSVLTREKKTSGSKEKSTQQQEKKGISKKRKVSPKTVGNIASTERLEHMLHETEDALAELQPKIEKLEQQLDKLNELKLSKQKLITLKLSLKSILSNFAETNLTSSNDSNSCFTSFNTMETSVNSEVFNKNKAFIDTSKKLKTSLKTFKNFNPETIFIPEKAFHEADSFLRRKTSVNYNLFQAIVHHGGKASTEQIRQYLIENRIQQPTHQEGFEEVPLTDISSRVNYLVRKGLVQPDERGSFIACVGWENA
jgi:hypothetical protein